MEQYNQSLFNEEWNNCIALNRRMKPGFIKLIAYFPKAGGKYVGCVHYKKDSELCVCINNSASKTLIYNVDKQKFILTGSLAGLNFSYTGGVRFAGDNCIYGIPRNSSKILRINPDSLEVAEIPILDQFEQMDNVFGHHYGGRLVGNCLYCVPRLSQYLLVIDLDTFEIDKIYDDIFIENNFNGVIYHPNGNLYFTPMQGSCVSEFNPITRKIRLIGAKLPVSLFGGAVIPNGNIYSYGTTGLYCVDVKKESVSLICNITSERNKVYGSYGTVCHFNGKIYNIPGNTPFFYEFDPESMLCRTVFKFTDGRFNKAKWAGGTLLENGNIFLVPAFGRFAAELVFDSTPELNENMRSILYSQIMNPL